MFDRLLIPSSKKIDLYDCLAKGDTFDLGDILTRSTTDPRLTPSSTPGTAAH